MWGVASLQPIKSVRLGGHGSLTAALRDDERWVYMSCVNKIVHADWRTGDVVQSFEIPTFIGPKTEVPPDGATLLVGVPTTMSSYAKPRPESWPTA
jgi:hypothetical protein